MESKKKSWVFRVASTPEVGGGHVMRCLSIGRELQKYQSVHFLLCKGGEYWIDRIKYYGITASIYESDEELENMNLLVDGYNFSDLDIRNWCKKCKYMAFIDDNDYLFDCANLVISTRMGVYKRNNNKQSLLQGEKYALISSEYIKRIPSNNANKVKNILITCGMRDSKNFTIHALKKLSENNFSGNVNIAIGSQAPYLQELSNFINNCEFSANILIDSNELYKLLLESAMVIGTGGVSLLERMSLGIPSVTIIAAENQRNQVLWSANIGATILVDPLEEKFQYNFTNAINFLLKSENKRLEMSNKGAGVIDGKGSYRVAKCMVSLSTNHVS